MICRFPLALTHLIFLLVLAQYCHAEVKITGVPDYQQGDFAGTNDCTPIASAVILGYWDANGFPNMIDGSNDFATNPTGVTDLVNALKTNMGWTSSGTQIDAIDAGIMATASGRGYTFSAANDYVVIWSDITAQINAGRPAVFTMCHANYGTLHSVGCLGYDEQGSTKTVIVHDNWLPPNDVYLNFDETFNRTFTTVVPTIVGGDANLDCDVNVLDLIFVRNRLNQDVGTGDNWQADVNSDGVINALDLIYVRNRLNGRCTE